MSKHNSIKSLQPGFAVVWILVWLAGMAGIIYYCAKNHIPAIQAQVQANAAAAVISAKPTAAADVSVDVDGRIATLNGAVDSEATRTSIVLAASQADGVARVVDNLELLVASKSAEAPATEDPLPQNADDNAVAELDNATDSSVAENPTATAVENANSAVEESTSDETLATNDASAAGESADGSKISENATVEPDATASVDVVDDANNNTDASAQDDALALQLEEEAILAEDEAMILQAEALDAESTEAAAQALIDQALAEARSQAEAENENTLATSNESNESNDSDAEVPIDDNDIEIVIAPDTSAISGTDTNTDTRASQAASSLESPTLQLAIDETTLTFSGKVSRDESLLSLIQTSMDVFDAAYVVNSVQVDDDTARALWLPELEKFMPALVEVDNVGIDIVESQITLRGEADSAASHDNIIDTALTQFSNLSLVERISVAIPETPVTPSSDTTTATLANDSQATVTAQQPTPEDTDTAQNENTQTQIALNDVTATPDADPDISAQALASAFAELEDTTILFESGKDVLTVESRVIVEQIADVLARFPGIPIGIEGHTDASGEAVANLKLSQLRANAVRDFLTDLGISAERLNAYGFGDGVPIADNATPEGRRLNRRIEFTF